MHLNIAIFNTTKNVQRIQKKSHMQSEYTNRKSTFRTCTKHLKHLIGPFQSQKVFRT